jgi:predicted GNAT family N-acyltransferase
MNIKEIEYDSIEYKKSIILRDKILRAPLGLYYTDDYLEQDKNQIILAGYEEKIIQGVLLLQIVNTSTVKMRQVAVKKNRQGKGVGTELVKYSENIAMDRDFKRMELHARDTAIHFYERLGYHCIGEEFEEIGIPHRKMFKNLNK